VANSHIESANASILLGVGDVSDAVTKTCASGVLLGGGAGLSGGKAAIQSSNPISNGWSAKAVGVGPGSSGTQTLTVYVVCSGT
jgi:hypothetical protein